MHVSTYRPDGPHIEMEVNVSMVYEYDCTVKKTVYMECISADIDSHLESACGADIGECEEFGYIEEVLDYKVWFLSPPKDA